MDSFNWKKLSIGALFFALGSTQIIRSQPKSTTVKKSPRPSPSPAPSSPIPNNVIIGNTNYLNGDANNLYGNNNALLGSFNNLAGNNNLLAGYQNTLIGSNN